MKIVEKYEPKLANGIKNIFGKSYEYTLKYREYKKSRKNNCGVDNQLSIFGENNE